MEEETVRIGGVVGILAKPLKNEGPKRLVLIMHGLGGHKNYCYQKLLGQELPKQLGYYTFRFDFRNCGDSDEVPGGQKEGRRVSVTDVGDINTVYDHFTAANQGYHIEVIVGHSRGTLAMFLWGYRFPEKSRYVKTMVNCSGRYVCSEYLTSTISEHAPEFLRNDGYYLIANRFGKYDPLWIPKKEVEEFATFDSGDWKNIPAEIDVLTIFGTKDHVVPVRDSAHWANLFAGRHVLKYVAGADHNFYGRPDTPGAKKKSYAADVVDHITTYLQPAAQLKRFSDRAISSDTVTRWPQVDGVSNFRDAGGYGKMRAGVLYRSGELSSLTNEGALTVQDKLKIRHIVDFRAPHEAAGATTNLELLPKVDCVLASVSPNSFSPQDLVERYADKNGRSGFVRAYSSILRSAGNAYGTAMRILRDYPGEPLLVHCTAGKDRTGVFCALVLLLIGVPPQIISRDYELTTFGLKSVRERLLLIGDQHGHTLLPKQVDHILSSKYESMLAAIDHINETYGSAANYLKEVCELTDEDLAKIRTNLQSDVTVGKACPHGAL